MTSYPHLRNAPIKEALVDIQVHHKSESIVSLLETVGDRIKDEFPKKKNLRTLEIHITGGKGNQPTHEDSFLGLRFETEDGRKVVQARLDGFTFSMMPKYSHWKDLRGDAFRLWKIYADTTSPSSIKRVAVRFINILQLSIPLNEYLTVPPILPKGLPFEMNGFVDRKVLHDETTDSYANITQILQELKPDGQVSVILDIDVFKNTIFEVGGNEAWDQIDQFHDLKNLLFFKSVTAKTVEKYK